MNTNELIKTYPAQNVPDPVARKIKRGRFVWVALAFAGALAAIVVGFFYAAHMSKKIDEQDRAALLNKVQTIALLTNASDLSALGGVESDIGTPAYERVKKTLYDIHDINSGARFVYYMRSNPENTKLIFLADSESPDSKDYSPPGEVYEDTSKLEMDNYINATPFVEGPYTDAWGSWVSGYAPIWYQGHLVGIFGIDISADKWEAQDHRFQKGIFAIAAFTGLWFVLLGLYLRQVILCIPETERTKAL